MTNVQASEVLEEWIRVNKPCNGLEQALLRAVTALRHQPEPQTVELPTIGEWPMTETAQRAIKVSRALLNSELAKAGFVSSVQCESCGKTASWGGRDASKAFVVCVFCGSSDLRPIYTTSEVKP